MSLSMETIAESLPASKYSPDIVETTLRDTFHRVASPDLVTYDGIE